MDHPLSQTDPSATSPSRESHLSSIESSRCEDNGEPIGLALSFLRHIARTCDSSVELRRIYDFFLESFARTEEGRDGEPWIPSALSRLVVATLAPRGGKIFDPCCGSGGMLVEILRFLEERFPKNLADLSLWGQEANPANSALARMNLAIRNFEASLEIGDGLADDRFPNLEADYVVAAPPFSEGATARAAFAWIDHALQHLAPTGQAGFVLANGTMASDRPSEGESRRNLVEADLVDCVVALPGQLLVSTQIPVCLWIFDRSKREGRLRDRRGELLLIDARSLGSMKDRVHRELSDDEVAKVAESYHAWRGEEGAGSYRDVAGFCRGVRLEEIRRFDHVLTPWTYVGRESGEAEDSLDAQTVRLTAELAQAFSEARRLEDEVRRSLEELSP